MKNAREEAIARCYAALTSLLILIGQLDEMGGQEDEVERLREQARTHTCTEAHLMTL